MHIPNSSNSPLLRRSAGLPTFRCLPLWYQHLLEVLTVSDALHSPHINFLCMVNSVVYSIAMRNTYLFTSRKCIAHINGGHLSTDEGCLVLGIILHITFSWFLPLVLPQINGSQSVIPPFVAPDIAEPCLLHLFKVVYINYLNYNYLELTLELRD